jgi:ATP-binding cassette subfamily B protein
MAEKPHTDRPAINLHIRRSPLQLSAGKVEIKDIKGTTKRIWAYLSEKRISLLLVLILTTIATSITIIGTRLNGYVIDTCIDQHDIHRLAIVCILMIAMYLVNAIATYYQNIAMIRISQDACANIRRDLFARLQKLPLSYFDRHSSGDLMSRLTNDVDNINLAMAQGVVQLFSSIISIAGMFIAMLVLSPILTLVSMVTVPLTYLISKNIIKLAQKYFVAQQRELGNMNGYIEEMISGQKIVKLFRHEADVQYKFEELNDSFVLHSYKAQVFSSIIGPNNNMINNLAYLAVSVLGGLCIIWGTGNITVGVIFSFLIYMRNFTNPVNNILNLVNVLQLSIASAERVFEVIDEDIEKDPAEAEPIEDIKGDIEMKDIHFSYLPGKPVLKGANISAAPGETVAIVGPTGAGKTTIINLLTKFYDIDSGKILIDGRNIDQITRTSLRHCISVVQQDTFLFSDTVRENIRYGRIDATDNEIEEVARQAYAHDFIMQMPQGYDTVLSDNGQNLSHGQRQLLSIARAILSNASVLILDEATSSIDTRTELLIQNAMLNLMKGRTSFVIAHRLSTIRNADNILVVNAGQILEQGNHQQLMAANGFYASFYNSQFKNYVTE